MKRRFTPAGYTILEVLIVMAVSSALFIMVALLMSGRQGQTELIQATRDLESNIQSIVNESANGYYPNGYKCTANDVGAQPIVSAVSAGSGENLGCVFLGKVMNFRANNINVLTIVGRQYTAAFGSAEVSTLALAKPLAVAQTGGPDATKIVDYKFNIQVTKIVKISDGKDIGGIGFLSQLGSSAGGNPMTGSRTIVLYALPGASPNSEDSITTANKIKDLAALPYPSLQPVTGGVRICLKGGNGKKAEITIGASGNQTDTLVLIDTGVGNEC